MLGQVDLTQIARRFSVRVGKQDGPRRSDALGDEGGCARDLAVALFLGVDVVEGASPPAASAHRLGELVAMVPAMASDLDQARAAGLRPPVVAHPAEAVQTALIEPSTYPRRRDDEGGRLQVRLLAG